MIRDDIVALLPDLRAFSRFLCREREAADDLVQNTILSALDNLQSRPGVDTVFIVNPDGVLQYSVVHDLNIGRSVDETLRVLQGLQTGGLCAADWTPGQENLSV